MILEDSFIVIITIVLLVVVIYLSKLDRIKKFSKKQLIDKYYSFYRFKYSENVYNSLISNTCMSSNESVLVAR
jgi:hypothetical protein